MGMDYKSIPADKTIISEQSVPAEYHYHNKILDLFVQFCKSGLFSAM